MKKLTCEMCGSTDMLKEDGVFVCQSCGCKYSVEEAKKMMVEGTVEIEGNVNVVNAAQLDNLINLARQSYESKNYSQAETFCNQILGIDDQNSDAWKIKGQAVYYQISSNSPRITEAYDCVMHSYRVLEESEKTKIKSEIYDILNNFYMGEVAFWLGLMENNRPTEVTVQKAIDAYVNSLNKIKQFFIELDIPDLNDCLEILENYFITMSLHKVRVTWENTVSYNYYRGCYINKKVPFGNGYMRSWKWKNDDYRPSDEVFSTYIDEIDNLIDLLHFCEKQFNDNTSWELKLDIYRYIIVFHGKACSAQSFNRMVKTTTNGYGAVTDRKEYWEDSKVLTEEAKKSRKNIIEKHQEKIIKVIMLNKDNISIDTLLETAYRYFGEMESDEITAEHIEALFEAMIKKVPNEPIGYIGKSIAINNHLTVAMDQEALSTLLKANDKSISDEYKIQTKKLINYRGGNSYKDRTLLMLAVANINVAAVKLAIKLGADVNLKDSFDNTPLETILEYSTGYLKNESILAKREIVKILLEHGGETHVILTSKTDTEVVNMVKAKYPATQVQSGGGCYVATAVYGSYDCPKVWTLRRYRDTTLASTWYGRAFIKTYYAISPTLVKWFGNTTWFKKMWQGTLDRMVANLQSKGFESTPYEDKEW